MKEEYIIEIKDGILNSIAFILAVLCLITGIIFRDWFSFVIYIMVLLLIGKVVKRKVRR